MVEHSSFWTSIRIWAYFVPGTKRNQKQKSTKTKKENFKQFFHKKNKYNKLKYIFNDRLIKKTKKKNDDVTFKVDQKNI